MSAFGVGLACLIDIGITTTVIELEMLTGESAEDAPERGLKEDRTCSDSVFGREDGGIAIMKCQGRRPLKSASPGPRHRT